MMLFWAWILLALDVWAFILTCIEMNNFSYEQAYKKIHFINSVSIPYLISRIIWGYRIYKYGYLFLNDSLHSTPIEVISAIEILAAFCTIIMIIVNFICFITEYAQSLSYKRCSLNLFLKTYKILDYKSDNYNLQYHCEDISFSFIPYLIAGELIYKKKSKDKKTNKRKDIEKSQKELYSMMISDLQKIQKEHEEKANKYFSQAEQTTKEIQKKS